MFVMSQVNQSRSGNIGESTGSFVVGGVLKLERTYEIPHRPLLTPTLYQLP